MATSTQRLLIMIIAINLVLSMSFAMYKAPRTMDYAVFGQVIDLGGDTADTYNDLDTDVRPENLQEEGSLGSALLMAVKVVGWFALGLVALPFSSGMYSSDPIMRLGVYALWVLWAMMYALIAIELYMFLKNRKTN